MYPWPPIGENIAHLRWLADLTQDELADKADVSADLIRRLEQGQRSTARIASLYRIAGALDVPISALFGHPNVLQPEDRDQDGGSILALREVLAPGTAAAPSAQEDTSHTELERVTLEAWRLYREGRFSRLAAVLPSLLTGAEQAVVGIRDEDRVAAFTVLSDAYNVTSAVLAQMGYEDLGYIAAQKSFVAAQLAGDPHVESIAANAVIWILMRQGRFVAAEGTALNVAQAIEPRFGETDARHLAAWGSLLWSAAGSAVRSDRPDQADDLLEMLRVAAERVGQDSRDSRVVFGPTGVAMWAVEIASERGDYGQALALAEQVPADGYVPLLTRTHHLLEVAVAQCHERPLREALGTLLEVRELAPEWMRYQVLARETVRALLGKRGASRRTDGLRELAVALAVDV